MSALSERIRATLAIDPTAPAVEFAGHWYRWGDLADAVDAVEQSLAKVGGGPGSPVGLLLTNRPTSLGLLLGVLCADACAVTLNPHLGSERVRGDLESLDLAFLAGDREDFEHLGALPSTVVRSAHSGPTFPVLSLSDLGAPPELELPGDVRAVARVDGIAVRMLTSGTTGPPKRVDLGYTMLERVMVGAKHYEANASQEHTLRSGVVIVNAPLVHVSGVFRVVQAVLDGRRICLLPRFTVDGWADAVRRHHPKTVSLVPTAMRMVLESDVEDSLLAGVKSVISGTAPLDPAVAEAFTARFGVPVLTSYGATEFGGGVAGWNLKDHERYRAEKPGSVGRVHPGCELRVVDQETFAVLPTGSVGLLEVKAAQLAEQGWIRTTDLAKVDDDGFLWILGRADQTILRGGFKVQPDTVRSALELHPGVRGASVFGVDDDRLGQVPVALVELREPGSLSADDLRAHLEPQLARYEVPTSIVIVDELPRTLSGKVDLAAAREMFEDTAE